MLGLEREFIEAPCPVCGYAFEVQLREVTMRSRTFCPNCKIAIDLVDERASTHRALESVNGALGNLERTLRRMGS